jgi:hypothetical protein
VAVYEKNIDKIGLLGVGTSHTVVTAYSEVVYYQNVIRSESKGKAIHDENAAYALARAFTKAGEAIERIKEDFPKAQRQELIMFRQPEIRARDVEFFLENGRKKREREQQALSASSGEAQQVQDVPVSES